MARLSRRLILWVGAGIVGLIALIAVGLVLVVLLDDPNRFKPRMEQAVQERTGRALQLRGDLRWRVLPSLVVSAGEGALGNTADFAGDDFARWQSLRLGVKLLPLLLHREVIIDSVRAEGVQVRLRRDAQGRVNWQFGDAAIAPAAATPLRIDALQLRRATLRYEDAGSGVTLEMSDLTLDAVLPAGTTTRSIRVTDFALAAQLRSSTLGAQPVAVKFAAPALAFDVDTATLTLPTWQAAFGPARLSGAIDRAVRAGVPVSATLQLGSASLRELLLAAGVTPPLTADPQVLGRLEFTGAVRYAAAGAQFTQLRMRLDDTQLSGSAAIAPLENGVLQFELTGDRIDLDRYLEPADVQGKPLELPLALLKSLRARGTLRLQQASLAGAVLHDVALEVGSAAAP